MIHWFVHLLHVLACARNVEAQDSTSKSHNDMGGAQDDMEGALGLLPTRVLMSAGQNR
jgi:hypothetical protein